MTAYADAVVERGAYRKFLEGEQITALRIYMSMDAILRQLDE
jgi:hypothetical protein